jgi:hypothetical protein
MLKEDFINQLKLFLVCVQQYTKELYQAMSTQACCLVLRKQIIQAKKTLDSSVYLG